MSSSGFSGPVAQRIQAALVARFSPTHLEVHNESHNHSATQESHFKVVIVSEAFEGMFAFRFPGVVVCILCNAI